MNTSHPLSAMFGFVVAGVIAFTTSQAAPPHMLPVPTTIRIEYAPHPRDMVRIKEGTPYVVPAGRIFVLTALGSNNVFGEPRCHHPADVLRACLG